MEPSGDIARQLAYYLEATGHVVVEVQPRLSRREANRLRAPGKTDPGDALAIARVVLREPNLAPIRQPGISEDLKLLVDYRTSSSVSARASPIDCTLICPSHILATSGSSVAC
jgi:transposase